MKTMNWIAFALALPLFLSTFSACGKKDEKKEEKALETKEGKKEEKKEEVKEEVKEYKFSYKLPGSDEEKTLSSEKGTVVTKQWVNNDKEYAAHSIVFVNYEDLTKKPSTETEIRIEIDVRGVEGSTPNGPLVAGKYAHREHIDLSVVAITGIQVQTFKNGEVIYDNMNLDEMKGTTLEITEAGAVVKGSLDITAPDGERKGKITLKGSFKATPAK